MNQCKTYTFVKHDFRENGRVKELTVRKNRNLKNKKHDNANEFHDKLHTL